MKWKLLLESEFLPTTHCSEDELSVLSQTIIVMTVLHFLLKRFDWGGKKNQIQEKFLLMEQNVFI